MGSPPTSVLAHLQNVEQFTKLIFTWCAELHEREGRKPLEFSLAFKKVSEINYIVWVSLFKEQAAAAAPAKILGLQQMKWMQGTWRASGQPAKPLLLEAQFSSVYSRWFLEQAEVSAGITVYTLKDFEQLGGS